MAFVQVKTLTMTTGTPYGIDSLKNEIIEGSTIHISKDHVICIKPFVFTTSVIKGDDIEETKHNLARVILCDGESFVLDEADYKKLM